MKRARRAFVFAGLFAIVAGLAIVFARFVNRSSFTVARVDGSRCQVIQGQREADVLDRCGKPCGEYTVPMSGCVSFPACAPRCEIYGERAVCFDSGRVVLLLGEREMAQQHVPGCHW